jgi:hypothetical protein
LSSKIDQLMRIKQFICLFILGSFVFSNGAFAQDDNQIKLYPKLELHGYAGKVIVHRDAMDSLANNPYLGSEVRLGFQSDGSKYWHSLYNYPIFGIGFYSANFKNRIIGKPKAAFLFMELPFIRRNGNFLSTSWSAGTTFGINEYDSISNPENVAIGSDMNVYVDFSLLYKYKFNNRWELGAGAKFQHFSNGAYAYPNLGLNMTSAVLSIAYSPGTIIKAFKTGVTPEKFQDIEIIPMVACSWRSKNKLESNIRYFNTTTSISINKRINPKRTIGVGFDHFYQGYLVEYYEDIDKVTDKDLMSYAGFLASDMVVDRFRLAVQLGFYMHRPVDFGLFFYQRVALRFYPVKKLFFNVSIKAHAAKAEFVEWGMGFNF